MMSAAHPFLRVDRAVPYESWYAGPGKRADRAEKRLLRRLLAGFPGARSVLEIGCGTGHFTRWMAALDFEVTGLDHSAAMLNEADVRGGARFFVADAHALPLQNGSVDLAVMMTALEFTSDPQRALAEAIRIARTGLILGVLNRTSLLAWRRRRSGSSTWNAARFFSPDELLDLVERAGGDRVESLWWRTTLWPLPVIGSLPLPWGGFIGMAVTLSSVKARDER
jgi:SAM-dependent methyltransferase